VDLLAKGERGLLTAVAGLALTAATRVAVAFVHARLTTTVPRSKPLRSKAALFVCCGMISAVASKVTLNVG